MHTKIKICGITRESELPVLNEVQTDYAGFVIFPGSKRYVALERAVQLKRQLDSGIRSVAVTVNPSEELMAGIIEAGFDVLQIHKLDDISRLEHVGIPVWLAWQVTRDGTGTAEHSSTGTAGQNSAGTFWQPEWKKLPPSVEGILLDAAEYGSGRTFSWEEFPMEALAERQERKLILAGGLTEENVRWGIRLFAPDIVDVSSSVEGPEGKDPDKIKDFVRKVREDE